MPDGDPSALVDEVTVAANPAPFFLLGEVDGDEHVLDAVLKTVEVVVMTMHLSATMPHMRSAVAT
jgi:hypothetical protein